MRLFEYSKKEGRTIKYITLCTAYFITMLISPLGLKFQPPFYIYALSPHPPPLVFVFVLELEGQTLPSSGPEVSLELIY